MYSFSLRTIFYLLLISVSIRVEARAGDHFINVRDTFQDTLRVKAGMLVILRDSFYVATADTIIIPGEERIRLRRDPYAHSKAFYDSLAIRSDRKKLVAGLYKVFIRDNAPVNTVRTNSRSREDELAAADGKVIRSIRTFNVPLLDGDVRDTAWIARSVLSRMMSFHPQTRRKFILSSVIPKVGERTDRTSLADAERLIRDMPGIRDAELYIVLTEHKDSIDVLIVTQDVFPLRAGVKIRGTDRFTLSFTDKNLDGRALELGGRMEYRANDEQPFDYRFTLRKSNVMGRYGDFLSEVYRFGSRQEQYLSFDRGFLTRDLIHLGGVRAGLIQDEVTGDSTGSDYQRFQTGGWYGRVFGLKHNWNLISAVSAERFAFVRKLRTVSIPFTLRDRLSLIGSVNLIRREFIRTALVTRFGVSEYFPVGESMQFSAGREFTSEFGRNYFAATGSFARFLTDIGFFGVTGSYAAFYRTATPEDISLSAGLDYFSPLLKWGRVRFRQFANIRLRSLEKQRFLSPWLVEGVRLNASATAESVTHYAVYGLETIWHMPWYAYGFRFAFFNGFEAYDVQIAAGRKWFPVWTAGIRLRNEYLVYSTLSLQVKWQPQKYGLTEIVSLKFSSPLLPVFNGLGIGKPALPY